jgi:hypothetical protein
MISLQMANLLKSGAESNAANCFLNFAPGMIFGTDEPQKQYIGALQYVTGRRKLGAAIVAANLRQATDVTSAAKKAYERVSNYWLESIRWGESITDFDASTNKGKPIEDRIARLLAVYGHDEEALQDHSKVTTARFDAHKKYQIRDPGTGAVRPMGETTLKYDMKVRRACKFLIYDAIAVGLKIHYILDGITSSSVADRMMFAVGDKGSEKVPICTSELREIFRHWHSLKTHVVWFRQFASCTPLWQEPGPGMKVWAEYAVSLLERRRKAGQAVKLTAKQLGEAMDKAQYKDIIVLYHSLDDVSLRKEFVNNVTTH